MRKKILKVIIILLFLLLLAYCIIIARRFYIINQIKNAYKQYQNIDNYYIYTSSVTESISGESSSTTAYNEMFYKENNYKQVINFGDTQLIFFVNLDDNIAFKFDSETKIKELIDIESAPVMLTISDLTSDLLISDDNYTNFLSALSIFSFNISTEGDSYVIKSGSVEECFNKETKLLEKQVIIDDYSRQVTNCSVEFGTVTDEMVNDI